MSDFLYKPDKENTFILEERTGIKAQEFTGSEKTKEVKLCVRYPVVRNEGWYFYVEVQDEGRELETFPLDLSNEDEVMAHIRKMNPKGFCEERDMTDYANWICR